MAPFLHVDMRLSELKSGRLSRIKPNWEDSGNFHQPYRLFWKDQIVQES